MTTTEIKTELLKKIPKLNHNQLEALYKVVENFFDKPEKKKLKERKLGTLPDLVKFMADDFDEPLDIFKDYMPE